jgi:hypothetical protein
VYLEEAVKSHAIWSDLRFWEEAFFDAYTARMDNHAKLVSGVLSFSFSYIAYLFA